MDKQRQSHEQALPMRLMMAQRRAHERKSGQSGGAMPNSVRNPPMGFSNYLRDNQNCYNYPSTAVITPHQHLFQSILNPLPQYSLK
jgi:hypothetical protein